MYRLLNELPANRTTATALAVFLKIAGYQMWGRYKGQFIKMLQVVMDEFLPALQQVTEQPQSTLGSLREFWGSSLF